MLDLASVALDNRSAHCIQTQRRQSSCSQRTLALVRDGTRNVACSAWGSAAVGFGSAVGVACGRTGDLTSGDRSVGAAAYEVLRLRACQHRANVYDLPGALVRSTLHRKSRLCVLLRVLRQQWRPPQYYPPFLLLQCGGSTETESWKTPTSDTSH